MSLLEILGALVLVHQSPLMILSNALFVNWKALPDQGIIEFLSIDPFLREYRPCRYCHQLCLLQSYRRMIFAGGGGCIVILSIGEHPGDVATVIIRRMSMMKLVFIPAGRVSEMASLEAKMGRWINPL